MMHKLTKGLFLALGLAAVQQVSAFTLWGPLEAWQTADLDYGLRYYYQVVDIGTRLGFDETGGPKEIGEASRLATPIITYGFDDTFLNYFGAQGVAAVDAAMQQLNTLPTSSSINLANYLTDGAEQINYTAQALELIDLKSTVMWLMVQHMGLLGETHVYDLQLRAPYGGGSSACDFEYYTVNRSYDPVTHNMSPYVNGRLYDYLIWDGCSIGVNVGDAIEFPEDTTTTRFSAVATGQGLNFGGYYLNLTRDDAGGLKYLYNKGLYVYQPLDSNSVVEPFANNTWEAVGTNAIFGISNFDGLVGGVGKITFVKVNFDSLLNPGFTPITYKYTIPYVTNSRLSTLSVSRTITAPDVLFTAANLINSEADANYTALIYTNTFLQSTYPSLGGGILPGTISSTLLVVLNNVGPVIYNAFPGFMDNFNFIETPVSNWGTFDGSTNAPIAYPNGTSLAELEDEVLIGGITPPENPWEAVLSSTETNATTSGGGVGVSSGSP